MTTLVTIVQNVCDQIVVSRPTEVIGSTDRTARQMLALLNRGGKTLARVKNAWGGGWQVLERVHTFTTTASEDEYSLPSDFENLLMDTAWDRDNYWMVRGPASPMVYQQIKSGLVEPSQLRKIWRIRRIADGSDGTRKFTLIPEPSAAEAMAFEYLSNGWVADSAGTTFADSFTADDDEPLLDPMLLELDLLWRFRMAKGLDFAGYLAEFEQERDRKIGAEVPARLKLASPMHRLPPVNIPDSGFG